MNAIQQILTGPGQPVAAGNHSIRPIVGFPGKPGRPNRSLRGIEIQGSKSVELVLYGPLDGKRGLVGVWFAFLFASRSVGIAAIDARRIVGQRQVGKQSVQVLRNAFQVSLSFGLISGESAARSVKRLNPCSDDLVRGNARLRQENTRK